MIRGIQIAVFLFAVITIYAAINGLSDTALKARLCQHVGVGGDYERLACMFRMDAHFRFEILISFGVMIFALWLPRFVRAFAKN